MTGNNPNLDLVNTNALLKFGEILSIALKILSGSKILTSIEDYIYIYIYTKFGKILSFCSRDIERKRNSDLNQGPLLYDKCVKNDV